jgi:benzoyl-CoA reductase subunit A
MKIYLGIDLGSTTTKAVILNARREIVGLGITNSRSNYDVACRVAKEQAMKNARFSFLEEEAKTAGLLENDAGRHTLIRLASHFELATYLDQLEHLTGLSRELARGYGVRAMRPVVEKAVDEICAGLLEGARGLFLDETRQRSDFFRDIAGSQYLELAETIARREGVSFESLMSIWDRAILIVEASAKESLFETMIGRALELLAESAEGRDLALALAPIVEKVTRTELEEDALVGTGYGRQTLPFSKECIRSEILCHGLGANALFPGTATVLDIGGQDTKAIQVDPNGLVTNFQMNDRCAAGCGRYLGYIADEMNMGLHELGPMALEAKTPVRINSTCTVFAGAEIRERLAVGQRREDILGGLHRAIILRAMSLLARSGGIRDEFTFTGGVAKNPAAVKALKELIHENYGEVTINIHPDSIYTGALGAALFARESKNSLQPVEMTS